MYASTIARPALAGLVVAVLAAAPASAAYLRWTSAEVDARTTDGCFVLAETTLKRFGFQDVRYAGAEVTGQQGPTYLTITCIATRPRPTAVVMAMGDNDAHAVRSRDEVAGRLRSHRGDPRDPL